MRKKHSNRRHRLNPWGCQRVQRNNKLCTERSTDKLPWFIITVSHWEFCAKNIWQHCQYETMHLYPLYWGTEKGTNLNIICLTVDHIIHENNDITCKYCLAITDPVDSRFNCAGRLFFFSFLLCKILYYLLCIGRNINQSFIHFLRMSSSYYMKCDR